MNNNKCCNEEQSQHEAEQFLRQGISGFRGHCNFLKTHAQNAFHKRCEKNVTLWYWPFTFGESKRSKKNLFECGDSREHHPNCNSLWELESFYTHFQSTEVCSYHGYIGAFRWRYTIKPELHFCTALCSTQWPLTLQAPHVLMLQLEDAIWSRFDYPITLVSHDLQSVPFLKLHRSVNKISSGLPHFERHPRNNRMSGRGRWQRQTLQISLDMCRFLGHYPDLSEVMDAMEHSGGASQTHCTFFYCNMDGIPDSFSACIHSVHLLHVQNWERAVFLRYYGASSWGSGYLTVNYGSIETASSQAVGH